MSLKLKEVRWTEGSQTKQETSNLQCKCLQNARSCWPKPSIPTHLSVLTTASTSGMLALWEIALSSLSSWLFRRRYLFLKQDSWGAGEKNMMNSRGRQPCNSVKSKATCLQGLQDQAISFHLSSSSQPFTLYSPPPQHTPKLGQLAAVL